MKTTGEMIKSCNLFLFYLCSSPLVLLTVVMFLLNTHLVKMVSPPQLYSINKTCIDSLRLSWFTVEWQAAICQQVNDWADDKWPFYHCNQCLLFGKQNDTVCIFQQMGYGVSLALTCEFVTWLGWVIYDFNVNIF